MEAVTNHASKREAGQTELIHIKQYWLSPRCTFYLMRTTRLPKKKKIKSLLLRSKLNALNPLRKAFQFLLSAAIQTDHVSNKC